MSGLLARGGSVAMQVAEKLGNTDLISIYNLRDDIKVPERYDRVGICTPTCFAESPRIVKEICKEMRLLRRQKAFIISTYGGARGERSVIRMSRKAADIIIIRT